MKVSPEICSFPRGAMSLPHIVRHLGICFWDIQGPREGLALFVSLRDRDAAGHKRRENSARVYEDCRDC